MRAVGYGDNLPAGDERALLDVTLDRPAPGARDLLVAVRAVSVNPVDVKLRAKAPPFEAGQPRVLGFDAAGIVEAVGSEASLFRPGDAVFYAGVMNRPGSNAEFQLVDERIVGRKPASLDFPEAAAMPLTTLTAWELLFDRLGVGRGEAGGALLVIGGAGGVGSILIQIARQLTGLTVIATASRPQTVEWCHRMGAHHVIDHRRPLDEELRRIGHDEVAYIATLTSTDRHLEAMARAVAPQGRIAVIDDPPQLDIMPFKRKSVSLHWEFMFARPLFQTRDMQRQHEILTEAAGLFDEGVLRTTMTRCAGPIDAATLRAVHAQLESGSSIGKTTLAGF